MNITLTAELAEFVRKKVKDGRYGKPSDVVAEALRLFQQGNPVVGGSPWPVLGSLQNIDIEELIFIVLKEAIKSADEDLKAIMAEVKATNAAKQKLRDVISQINKDVAANAAQKHRLSRLDFSKGMGSEKAYHQAQMPFPDPCSASGVKFVTINLYDGPLNDVAQLEAILEDLKGRLDSMSEMSEMTSIRLQMAMDRRSKMIQTLSNIMKKFDDTQSSLAQNLK